MMRDPRAPRASAAGTVAAVLVGSALAMLVSATGADRYLSNALYDAALRQRTAPPVSRDVVLVAITTEDVHKLQQPFPWPRSEQSVIYEKIADRKPSVVAVDMLYSEPSAEATDDAQLASQLARCGRVVAAAYFADHGAPATDVAKLLPASGNAMGADVSAGDWPVHHGAVLPTPDVARAVTRVGHVHVAEDADGVFRRVPLVVRDRDRFYPSLCLQAVLLHLGADWSQVRLTPGELSIVNIPNHDNIRIPLDAAGRMLLNYPRDLENAFEGVNVWRLVAQNEAPEMAGRIVMVGAMVTGHGDMYTTPVQPLAPGLMIQAAATDAILRGDFLREAAGWQSALMIVVLALVAGACMALLRPLLGAAVCVVVGGAAIYSSVWMLGEHGLWLSPVAPAAAVVVVTAAMVGLHIVALDRRRRDLSLIFGRYVDRRLLDEILRRPESFSDASLVTPRRKEMTIFFSDLRSFVEKAAHLEPEDLGRVLNGYFERMIKIAHEHQGTVNKLMGDGMLVFFNDPLDQPDHAARCLRMAIAMQRSISQLNSDLARVGLPAVAVAMGVNTGYVTVGNLGSSEFTDYTVIGPTVNLAARLTELAPPGAIWTTDRTRRLCEDAINLQSVGEQTLKGVADPVEVFAWRESSDDAASGAGGA